MKGSDWLVAVVMIAASATPLSAGGLQQATLAGLSSIGGIIVTAANDTVSEDAVRRTVERRLARAGIVVDESSNAELRVNVTAERGRAESSSCECGTFRVSVELWELVAVERAPDQPIAAITWRTSGAIRRFSTASPRRAIIDVLEEDLSSFLAAVASDTQQAAKNPEPQ